MTTWYGKKAEDMSREELIKAFEELAKMHMDLQDKHIEQSRRTVDMFRDMAMMKARMLTL